MAAYFYTFNGQDVFNTTRSDGSILQIDFLDNVVTDDNYIMYTSLAVQTSEIIQYFLTFDDIIDYFHFGKGLGNVVVNGMIFSDCNCNLPGVDALYSAFGSVRGQSVKVSFGSYAATAVVVNSSVEVVGEPDTMASFSITLNIISDSQ
jgi:hypothetical protein